MILDPSSLSPAAIAAARKHAIDEYPREACGYVVGSEYIPVENRSKDPEHTFRIAAKTAHKYRGAAALIHSHPDGLPCPSSADMRGQDATRMPWGIIKTTDTGAEAPFFFGDQVQIPDLMDRPFRHGVTDCYSAIRDWYRIKKDIVLPIGPRDWEWWADGGDLYLDNFAGAGFKEIPSHEVQPGDLFLAAVGAGVTRINHGGILVSGTGLAYHHYGTIPFKPSRKPRLEPLNRWMDNIKMWLRYVG